MKKLILIIFLSLLTFRVEAVSMETMYKYCKPWQSKGFDTDKITNASEAYRGYYFSGLIDAGYLIAKEQNFCIKINLKILKNS